MVLTAVLAFFQAIPAITGGITAFSQAYFNAKVELVRTRVGGDRDVAVAIVNGTAAEGQNRNEWMRIVSQSKFLMWMVGLWSAPWIAYEWKVVLWDKIACKWFLGVYGFTPPVDGLVGEWAGVILAGIFGTGGVMAAGALFFNRRERS